MHDIEIREETRVQRWGGLAGVAGSVTMIVVFIVVAVFVGVDPAETPGTVQRFPDIRAARTVENTLYLVVLVQWMVHLLALYLLIVALGGLAQLAVRAGIRVPGFPAQGIPAGPTPAPVSLAADLAAFTILAVVGATAYLLLQRIDRRGAGVLIVFAAVAAGMILINLAFHNAALLVATGPGTAAVGSHRSGGLVVLLLDLHDHGYTITGAFFGLWLLALGYLTYQSSLFPWVLSTLLIVSLIVSWLVGVGWPGLPTIVHTLLAPHPVADLWLAAYLVTKGVPARRPDRLAPAGGTA